MRGGDHQWATGGIDGGGSDYLVVSSVVVGCVGLDDERRVVGFAGVLGLALVLDVGEETVVVIGGVFHLRSGGEK